METFEDGDIVEFTGDTYHNIGSVTLVLKCGMRGEVLEKMGDQSLVSIAIDSPLFFTPLMYFRIIVFNGLLKKCED